VLQHLEPALGIRVDGIRHQVQSAKVANDDVPRDLTDAEFEEIRKFGAE